MRRPRARSTGLLALGLVVVGVVGVAAIAQEPQAVPEPHNDILLAVVTEDVPYGPLPGRLVTFTLELAGEPVCTPDDPSHIYGFLLDADRNPQTAAFPSDAAWDDLGIEARIAIDCDPQGQWVQLGDLPFDIAQTPDDSWVITWTVAMEGLPSPAFTWIAFAQDETAFWRTPDKPDVGAFAPTAIDQP